jgi:chromosome transmission fidelity protein 4
MTFDLALGSGNINHKIDTSVDEIEATTTGIEYTPPTPQPPFNPASTELGFDDDNTRKPITLCWNYMGAVTTQFIGRHCYIDIEFRDSAFRRCISVVDAKQGIIIGSLGPDGAIFATDKYEDFDDEDLREEIRAAKASGASNTVINALVKEKKKRKHHDGEEAAFTGSVIHFHRYSTFGPVSTKDWDLTLPAGERVVTAATGDGWASVCTSRNWLRTYTSAGVQGDIISVPGVIVTSVGRGAFLTVIYHGSAPDPNGKQNLNYMTIDLKRGTEQSTGAVAISNKSKLEWAGISDDYMLTVLDSDGMVAILAPGLGWRWSPVLDLLPLQKHKGDSFWPISVLKGKLICVPLKGGNQHPEVTRRPVTSALAYRMPVARTGAAKQAASLEDVYIRANMALKQRQAMQEYMVEDGKDAEELETEYENMCDGLDEVTMVLFDKALKSSNLERAVDLTLRFMTMKSFEMAITLADRGGGSLAESIKNKLCKMIENIRDTKFPPVEEVEVYMEEEEEQQQQCNEEEEPVGQRRQPQAAQQEEEEEEEVQETMGDEDDNESRPRVTPNLQRQQNAGEKRSRDEDDDNEEDVAEDQDQENDAGNEIVNVPAPASIFKKSKKSFNPFAKQKLVGSPSKQKHAIDALLSPSPTKTTPSLNRSSTFSAQSRQKSNKGKRIL